MSHRLDTIAGELLALKDDAGMISAPGAVRWARANPESRLHGALDWNDETAAEQHRVWQVRSLIALHVVDASGERRFVSLSIDRERAGGYRPVADVLANETLRDIMLRDALAELERVRKRYEKLTELVNVWTAVDRVPTPKRARRKVPEPA